MLGLVLGLTAFAIVIYYIFFKTFSFWPNKGVEQPPFLRNAYYNWFLFFHRHSVAHLVQKMYNECPNARMFGLHQFNQPAMVLKDPELIKQITIKNFDHFTDHKITLPDNVDPIVGKSLISLKGQQWRIMRNILSPTFTGSKMKILFHLIIECTERFVNFFDETNEDLITLEMQDTFTRYCNDVIASVIFGIEVDSMKEPNNEFYLKERELTELNTFTKGFKFILAVAFPKIYKFFDVRLFKEESVDFFRKLVEQSIKLREEKGVVRPDMIHLLLEAKRENNAAVKKAAEADSSEENSVEKSEEFITVDDMVAQAFIFFFAGFDSISRFLCFAAYELAVNQDVQEKLREEIKETNEKCQGKLTYESLTGMKYMDNVLSEVMRKYPTNIATDRVCTKAFVVEPARDDEKPVLITPGIALNIPTIALHNDPLYFPDPDRFDPDRFNDENKKNIPPYVFQPFGLGPRNCIGNRFALLEAKAAFFHILNKYEIVPVEKTRIPFVFLKSMFTLSAEGGFWMGLKRIKETEL